MSALNFQPCAARARLGLKGPRGAGWLAGQGIALPPSPNTWTGENAALLVARLGASEFFLEAAVADAAAAGEVDARGGHTVRRLSEAMRNGLPGVYPVLREDAAFVLSGEGACDALAQVCNVNFAALDLTPMPLVMTLLIGVSVLIVPQASDGGVRYRIWCDPTFGSYVDESVGRVVVDCGGSHGGVSA
jgi:sarcosine oxidase subunit gamma